MAYEQNGYRQETVLTNQLITQQKKNHSTFLIESFFIYDSLLLNMTYFLMCLITICHLVLYSDFFLWFTWSSHHHIHSDIDHEKMQAGLQSDLTFFLTGKYAISAATEDDTIIIIVLQVVFCC